MTCEEISYSDHAISQMFRRNISVEDINSTLKYGVVVSEYVHDRPFPSYLILGFVGNRPIHVVVAKNDNTNQCIIITAYQPERAIWESDFKSKRKK